MTGRDWHYERMTTETYAERVRQARLALGWSKESAARKAGISSITWKRIEDGLSVQEASMAKALKALGVVTEQRSTYVAAPDDGKGTGDASLDDIMREIRQMRADIEDLKRGRGRDIGT